AEAFGAALEQQPTAHSQMLIGLDLLLGPTTEIVLAGDGSDPVLRQMAVDARMAFRPRSVLLHRPPGDCPLAELAPFVQSQTTGDGAAAAFICRDFACELPVRSAAEFRGKLGSP